MNTIELVAKMTELLKVIKIENEKTAKVAHGRARKAASELKTLAAEFKRTSSAEDKA
jgi:hypothetical protein